MDTSILPHATSAPRAEKRASNASATPSAPMRSDDQLLEQAAHATRTAFLVARNQGLSVLYAQGDELCAASDGARRVVKTLPPGTSLPIGTEIAL